MPPLRFEAAGALKEVLSVARRFGSQIPPLGVLVTAGMIAGDQAMGLLGFFAAGPAAANGQATTKAFPRVQVVPLPDGRASFQFDGTEKLRYHYAKRHTRPFWFPLIGPAGRPLTRITHPHDPNGHSHHKSIWIAHHDVNGLDFWSDSTRTRIVHDAVVCYDDGPDAASMTVRNRWLDGDGRRVLAETRTTRLIPLRDGELFVDIELTFTATDGSVTFGKTPFGFLGVRVAKTIGVHDGGGTIRNSEGGVNEKQVLWKRARWVDYSGPIAPDAHNGITLMDHPTNPRYPTYYHVRNDGWMGASFCYENPCSLAPKQSLKLKYRLYGHKGDRSPADIDAVWKRFAAE